MNLPFSLVPRSKQDMYFFAYGAAVMSVVSMAILANFAFNINTGMEARIMQTLQNATITVNYVYGGGC